MSYYSMATMGNKIAAIWAVVFPVTGILILQGQLPVNIKGAHGNAAISIVAYSCKKDQAAPPLIQLLKDPVERSEDQPLKATTIPEGPGVWHISARIPIGHWFLRLLSPHCGAFLETTSINGESRSFATGLYYGHSVPLDIGTNYVAGTLPFTGATDIFLSLDGSPINAQYPIVVGQYFYFDALATRDYFLVIKLGLYQLTLPISFSGRSGTGAIENIKTHDFSSLIQNAPI